MEIAKRIDEFTPDEFVVVGGYQWLAVNLTPGVEYEGFKALPEIVEYNGDRYYRMSWNSDTHKAYYKEAGNKPYHLRFA